MNNIFFGLNTKQDIYLISQLRTALNKISISYNIDYADLDMYKHAKIPRNIDAFRVIYNYIQYNDIYNGVSSVDQEKKDFIDDLLKFFDNLEYDIYCFSVFEQYSDIYTILCLHLKNTQPNSKVLIGGPEITQNHSYRLMMKSLGVYCTTGDLESSMISLLKGNISGIDSYYPMTRHTIDDVPRFDDQELDYMNRDIIVSGSRGCANNCYFCCSPRLSRFTMLDRSVLVGWIDYYNKIGVNKLRMNDATLNIKDFDVLLDGLLSIKNNISIYASNISFNGITINQIKKMKRAGVVEACIGLECLEPVMQSIINKKMPPKSDIYTLIKSMVDNGVITKLFYIAGLPGQTMEIFYKDLDFIKKLQNDFCDSVYFEFYDYFVSRKSVIHNQFVEFGITETPNSRVGEFSEPDFKEMIRTQPDYITSLPTYEQKMHMMSKLYEITDNYVPMINSDEFKK